MRTAWRKGTRVSHYTRLRPRTEHACWRGADVVTGMGVRTEGQYCRQRHQGCRGLADEGIGRLSRGTWRWWVTATIRMMVHLIASLIMASARSRASFTRPREPAPPRTSAGRTHCCPSRATLFAATRSSRSATASMAGKASRITRNEIARMALRRACGISRSKAMSPSIPRRTSALLLAYGSRPSEAVMLYCQWTKRCDFDVI